MSKYHTKYNTFELRPLPGTGLAIYGDQLKKQDWFEIYSSYDINLKTDFFQNALVSKFYEIFPKKCLKISNDDQPWFSDKLKSLDRCRKREFYKNKKSDKWKKLNLDFFNLVEKSKNNYRQNIVEDLKRSNPSQWYSKFKQNVRS